MNGELIWKNRVVFNVMMNTIGMEQSVLQVVLRIANHMTLQIVAYAMNVMKVLYGVWIKIISKYVLKMMIL